MSSAGVVPILMYHDIADEPSPISVSTSTFAAHMALLRDECHVVSLDRVVDCIRSERPLPERAVVLTFDDGFDSAYTTAFPLLARYSFPATVFLVSDYCGKRNDWPGQPPVIPIRPLMSWNQAREMARHGIEFGAHTCSHPRLDRVPARCTDEQILRSRDVIEGQLGRVIRHFAYPYGRISKHATTIVARSFYAGCGTSLGMVDSTSDPFALERVDARYVDPRLGLTSRRFGLYLTLLGPLRRGRSLIAGRAW